jgi:hypothetical protein
VHVLPLQQPVLERAQQQRLQLLALHREHCVPAGAAAP